MDLYQSPVDSDLEIGPRLIARLGAPSPSINVNPKGKDVAGQGAPNVTPDWLAQMVTRRNNPN